MDPIESLFREYAPAVFRFAWGLSGDRSQAEDIVSETFVRLLSRAPKVETKTALAYLLAIARNTYISGLRKRKREVPLTGLVPAFEWDPAIHVDEQARIQTLLAALGRLPEGERTALLLRVDHDLSYEEIGQALGISAGAAKIRVHRARLRLARAVGLNSETED